MRVSVTRSGGFAGLHRTADLDTSLLPAPGRQAVEAALRGRRGAGAAARRSSGADRFTYEVRYDDGSLADIDEGDSTAEVLLAALRDLFR